MEFVVINKEDLDNLFKQLNDIHLKIGSGDFGVLGLYVDNDEFIKLMKISKRTAQTWRDEGAITFHQQGNKIYYSKDDIDEFFKRTKKPMFK